MEALGFCTKIGIEEYTEEETLEVEILTATAPTDLI